jgi:adenylate kinase
VCDRCGGKLFLREDDHPDLIRIRMGDYGQSTKPLLEYYERKGQLVPISATGSPGEILKRTLSALRRRRVMV